MILTIRPLADWSGERTPAESRKRHQFTRPKASGYGRDPMPWSDTLAILERELTALGASNVILQINVTERDIRRDGQLRADARPADPAVRLLFDSRHGALTYQCDRFATWQDNGRAIALGLEALRKVERYGITEHGQQYKGWLQLEAGNGPSTMDAASEVIWRWSGLTNTGALPDSLTYRAARAASHPDRNGGMRSGWDAVEAAGKTLGLAR